VSPETRALWRGSAINTLPSPTPKAPMSSRGSCPTAASLFLFCAPTLAAQSALAGIVRADSSGQPLGAVEVLIQGTSLKATTGLNGRYHIEGAPAGRWTVLFRLVGYLPSRSEVLLTPGDTTRANAMLIPGVMVLDPITVRGKSPLGEGREGFEERRRLGFGKFYDSLVLRRSEHLRLADLLRRQGGVSVERLQLDRAPAHVAYHPYRRDPYTGALNCPMQIYLNGSKVESGGRLSKQLLDLGIFDIASLEAIEVFRSAAQVPGIYSGPTADCGVILLWSRQK
jgi:hypothetical protein